jgi:hypothetical protein
MVMKHGRMSLSFTAAVKNRKFQPSFTTDAVRQACNSFPTQTDLTTRLIRQDVD